MQLPDLFDLTGRTAFITGSSRGLGWSTAQCLAQLGAKVAINGRSTEAVEARCREIEQAGGKAYNATCDVTDGDAFDAVLDDIIARAGPIDILVASAAHFLVKPIEDTTRDDILALLDGKLFSAMAATSKLAPGMRERGWGRIVLVSSIGVIATGGVSPVESAASGALTAFSKAISTAFAPHGVTCNTVAPGYFDTDLTADFRKDPGHEDWIASSVPVGRWGRPDEIGWPVAFLCTDAAAFITGHTLIVDGGTTSSC
jgi:gluconate 5-dehydrogenase